VALAELVAGDKVMKVFVLEEGWWKSKG